MQDVLVFKHMKKKTIIKCDHFFLHDVGWESGERAQIERKPSSGSSRLVQEITMHCGRKRESQ